MNTANRLVVWCWLVALLVPCLSFPAGASTNSVQSAVALLNAGDLAVAERILRANAKDAAASGRNLDEAVARKWLGLALARSGAARMDEATNELWQAVALLGPLAERSDKEAKSELGFAFFDLAETLRTCADIRMRDQRMTGAAATSYFVLVHDLASPAEDAIEKAVALYPNERTADLDYARGELALLLARLQATFMPDSDTAGGYGRSMSAFRKAIKEEQSKGIAARNDVIISAAIRIAETGRELAARADAGARRAAVAEALKELDGVRYLSTDQAEIEAHLIYTRAICFLEKGEAPSSEDANEIETDLLKAADLVESMRGKFVEGATFENAGSFFSQRTHVYEALCRLYAATKQPGKMLAAIEKMKARAFRDMLSSSNGAAFNLATLQQHLRQEKAGLAEFFYGPERAWVVWVPPDAPVEIIDLPIDGQSLVMEMRKVEREFAHSRDPPGWRRMLHGLMRQNEKDTMKEGFLAANRLYELLLRPLDERARAAKVTRLYVVPHHVMNYLSFNSLVTELNEGNLLASTFYVEHGLPVTYLPSAAVLADVGPIAGLATGGSYVFSRSDFHSISPTFQADLVGTIKESEMVARTASAALYREADASESRLRNLSSPFNLLYFATHGYLDPRRPLDSYVLLAATSQAAFSTDGRVTIGELLGDMRGRLHANLVVLSACQTNEGEPNPASGDDLSALSRGFMVAGARSVLATQWGASDDTFPMIMGFFLNAWMKQGQPKDAALAAALQDFLSTNDFPVWRHPHFWASVILLGEAE